MSYAGPFLETGHNADREACPGSRDGPEADAADNWRDPIAERVVRRGDPILEGREIKKSRAPAILTEEDHTDIRMLV